MSPLHVDGPTVLSFSGGRTSAYMLRKFLMAHGGKLPADCHVVFANTGKEEEATLRFVRDCGELWGVPIVWVEYAADAPGWRVVDFASASRSGEPFEALIRARNYLPNPVARFCTVELKILRIADRTAILLGYSVDALRSHLEAYFEPGMSWSNYGKGDDEWSVDHSRPISSFPAAAPLSEINALGNLRPMWHRKNCSKGNRWGGQVPRVAAAAWLLLAQDLSND